MTTRSARPLAALLAGLVLLCAGSAEAASRPLSVKAPAAARVVEGAELRVRVTLPRKARVRTVVKWSLPAAGDFARTKGSLVFAKGRRSATLRIATKQDGAREADEAHRLKIGKRSVKVTLVDDERPVAPPVPAPPAATQPQTQPQPATTPPPAPPTQPAPPAQGPLPTVSVGDLTRGESSADKQLPEITLSAPSTRDVVVRVETADGTAIGGTDFSQMMINLTIKAGKTKATVPVQVVNDSTDEPSEAFKLTLSAPENATIADGEGLVTITDDDDAPVLSVADGGLRLENNTTVGFDVKLSNPTTATVTVKVTTLAGTAGGGATCSPGADYVSISGLTVTFNPGQTTKTVNVTICEDNVDEPDETFSLSAHNLSAGATLGDSQGTATIQQDED